VKTIPHLAFFMSPRTTYKNNYLQNNGVFSSQRPHISIASILINIFSKYEDVTSF